MKKLTTLFWLLLSMVYMLSAQTFIDETFNTVPPSGWSKAGNFWTAGSSANAGGTAKELSLSYSVTPNDYLRTGAINTSGLTNLNVSFKTKIDHWSNTGGYACKIQASSDGSTWSDVWVKENLTTADYGPATDNIQLTEANGVGSATFYLQFIFTGATANFNYWYVDDFKVQNPINMAYSSSDAIQTGSGNVLRGNSNVKVLQIPVVTTGSLNPLSVSKLTVNAEGSTNLTKISNAKIFYTGTSSTFATPTQFGATVASPTSTDFEISGTQLLAEGTNYFWLTFDVAADAADGDQLDAECKSVTVNGEDKIPTNTDPAGAVTIKSGMSGIKTIGTGGDYATITTALADLNTLGLEGPTVLELKANYVSTGETFPLVFTPFVNSSSVNTVTIRPAADAVNLSITAPSGTTIDFEGADYVIIDGQPNGMGGLTHLAISNSSSPTITFYEDSKNNTFKYCDISTTGSASVLSFGTASATGSGNDNNVIEFCNVHGPATNLIYSNGSSGKENSSNIIRNNNLYDFATGSGASFGINVSANNSDWTIQSNRIFRTATTSYGAVTNGAIQVSNTGNSYIIENNIIGYANADGTGTYTIPSSNNKFNAIYASVGSTTASSIKGNIIRNISHTTTSGGTTNFGAFCGINVAGGLVYIENNILGEQGTVNGIVSTNTSTASLTNINLTGIYVTSSASCKINGNNISSLTANGSGTNISSHLQAVSVNGTGSIEVKNNLIGSAGTNNSIQVNATGTGSSFVYGIKNTCTGTSVEISSNTIANITGNATGSSGVMHGANNTASSGTTNFKANEIYNLTSNHSNTGTGSSFPFAGYYQNSSAALNFTGNTIRNLNATHATVATSISGIHTHATGTASISGNKVYGIIETASGTVSGISNSGTGTKVYSNNMITLGADITGSMVINGFSDNSGANNFYYNSVCISGTNIAGSSNTYSLYSTASYSYRIYKNNLLINNRSNGTGTGKHYGIKTSNDTPSYMTSDYNNISVSGTGGVFGQFGSTDVADFATWKTTANQDANSKNSNITFEPSTTGDLKYQRVAANADVFNTGTPISGYTTDFYGTTRPQYAQVDIGAHELVQSSGLTESAIPVATSLSQNYPNPFNPETTINFALAKNAQVNLTIFNSKGEVVKTLVNSSIQAGYHSVNFNAVGLNSGVYFYKLTTPESSFMKKMLMVK